MSEAGKPIEPKKDDALIRRFEHAARHLGCEHMIPWARFRMGYERTRTEPPKPSP